MSKINSDARNTECRPGVRENTRDDTYRDTTVWVVAIRILYSSGSSNSVASKCFHYCTHNSVEIG